MIKPKKTEFNESADVHSIEIALIKKDISTIKDNHLAHIEKDMNLIHNKVDKLDNRLWWVLGILIASTVGTVLAGMFT